MPKTGLSLVLAATAAALTSAHLPFIELERARKSLPRRPEEDLTFENPFDILKESTYPDVTQACTPVPGNPTLCLFPEIERPQMSLYLESVLHDKDDVDWFMYDKTDADSVWHAYAYPIIPYCQVYSDFMPEVAFLGPLGTKDVDGNEIFKEMTTTRFTIPDGYGAFILDQSAAKDADEAHESYFAPEAKTSWWLPYGWPAKCIDGWSDDENKCNFERVIFKYIKTPGKYYFAFYDKDPNPSLQERDVALVVGSKDEFKGTDWPRVDGISAIVSEGRSVSNPCFEPSNKELDSSAKSLGDQRGLILAVAGVSLLRSLF